MTKKNYYDKIGSLRKKLGYTPKEWSEIESIKQKIDNSDRLFRLEKQYKPALHRYLMKHPTPQMIAQIKQNRRFEVAYWVICGIIGTILTILIQYRVANGIW